MNLKQAKRLALHSQGLLQNKPFGLGIDAVQRTIDQLHYIQIDTISVVDRAHHHILNTRIPNYSPTMLHELQSNRQTIFEYWSHAAAYLPIRDYRYYLPIMKAYKQKRSIDKKLHQSILKRLQNEGPLQSRDFKAPIGKKSTGWWDWKPAKRTLEKMFLSGELMIKERQGFQKVYDLTERILPDHVDTSTPTHQERGRFYVRRMLTSLGIAQAREIGYARTTVKYFSDYDIQTSIKQSIQEMQESGEITAFGLGDRTYYCLTESLEHIPQKLGRKQVRFLSPFDNLLINRKRLLELFTFDYQLECYVPEAKRKFGYFVLPILFGDEFIGRLDCKADRKVKNLIINNIWLEKETKLTDKLIMLLVSALIRYKNDLQCESITVTHAENRKLKQKLCSLL